MSKSSVFDIKVLTSGIEKVFELTKAFKDVDAAAGKLSSTTSSMVEVDGKLVQAENTATIALNNFTAATIKTNDATKQRTVTVTQDIVAQKAHEAAVKAAEKATEKQQERQKGLNQLAGYYKGLNTQIVKSVDNRTVSEENAANRRSNILRNEIRTSSLSVEEIKSIWKDATSNVVGNYTSKTQQQMYDTMKASLDAQSKLGELAKKRQLEQYKADEAQRTKNQMIQKKRYEEDAAYAVKVAKDKAKRLNEIEKKRAAYTAFIEGESRRENASRQVAFLRSSIDPSKVPNGARASQKELFDLEYSVSKLKNFLTKNKFTTDAVKQMWVDLQKGPRFYNGELDNLQRNMQPIVQAYKRLGTEATNADKSMKGLLISMKSAVRLVGVQLAHQAISMLTRSLIDSIGYAVDLQIKIAEIQTLDDKKLDFSQWRNEIISISNAYGVDALDQAKAAYETLSNQIAEGADSFKFLDQAAKFAVTTVSTSGEAVDLLSSAINAYGLTVDDTHAVASSFFKTIDLGRVRASEMANTFGRLAVPARMAGISLQELQAAITVTTRMGVKYSESATLIRNVILKLINPTEEMVNLIRSMGYESGEAWVKGEGFGKVLQDIENYAKGSSTEIHDLFNTIRATVGAMVFSGDGIKQFNKDLEELNKATLTYDSKLDIIMGNSGKRVQIFHNELRNFARGLADLFVELEAEGLRLLDKLSGFDITLVKEDELKKNISLMRGYTEALTKKQNDMLTSTYRLANNNLTQERRIIFEKQDLVIEGIKEQKEIITKSNDDELNSLREKLSEEKKILSEHKKNVLDTEKDIRDQKIEINKKILESQFSEANNVEKLGILDSSVKRITRERNIAFDTGDLGSFDAKSKELVDTIFKYKDVLNSVSKNNTQIAERRRGTTDIQYANELFRQTERKHKQDERDIKNELRKARTTSEKAEVVKKSIEIEKEYKAQQDIIIATTNKIKPDAELRKAEKDYTIKRRQLSLLEQTKQRQSELNAARQKAVISTAEHETQNLPTAEDIKKVSEEAVGARDWDKTFKAQEKMQKYVDAVVLSVKNASDPTNKKNLKDFLNLLLVNQQAMQANVLLSIKQNALDSEKGKRTKQIAKDQEEYNKKITDLESINKRLSEISRSTFYKKEKGKEALREYMISGTQEDYEKSKLKIKEDLEKYNNSLFYEIPIVGQPESIKELKEALTLLDKVKPGAQEALQKELQEKNMNLASLEKQNTSSIEAGNKYYEERNSVITSQIDLLKKRNELESSSSKVSFLSSLFGMKKAGGGFIHDTMDDIPAMLSAGEYVINAKSTRKFFNQLQAINAPQPRGYASGGMVTTVGDVNISLQPSGNTQVDVIAIGKALKREIRRGTISL